MTSSQVLLIMALIIKKKCWSCFENIFEKDYSRIFMKQFGSSSVCLLFINLNIMISPQVLLIWH